MESDAERKASSEDLGGPSGRSFGYWTRLKLEILQNYLPQFLKASASVSERVYLDAFAGVGSGMDRVTSEEFLGSARIAMESGGECGFTKLMFFEMPDKASNLKNRLQEKYPNRSIDVYPGDCNITMKDALDRLKPIRWAPTFAFLDPDGVELAWDTVALLARHKVGYKQGRAGRENKVEIWMLFTAQGIMRTLDLSKDLESKDIARANRLFGTEAWRHIYDLRKGGEIDGAESRERYVELMRWRLEVDLGYTWTHALEFRNTRNGPIYHMIFATDNPAGNRIMQHLYGKTLAEMPFKRSAAVDGKRGQLVMPLELEVPAVKYEYVKPVRPEGL